MTSVSAVSVLIFVLIHLFVGVLRFLDGIPRSRWLSFAGGVAVAYVFLHVLPELGTHQNKVRNGEAGGEQDILESEIYLVALAGLAAFYGLERHIRGSRSMNRERIGRDTPEEAAFWLHIGSFAIYNLLIGYLLLHREEPGLWSLAIYTIAIALHFVTNDYGLRHDYKEGYDGKARWVLAASVLLGWLLGFVLDLSETTVGFLFAFIAGGIVLNVLKEELPEERKSRFVPFACGSLGYAALLIFAE